MPSRALRSSSSCPPRLCALAQTFPALTGRVVDAANLLKPEERAALEAKLKAHEDKTTDQVVVATVPSLEGYRRSRIMPTACSGTGSSARRGKNNGALLLVAPKERKVRIEVGYGLEGALTDALSQGHHRHRHRAAIPEGRFRRRASMRGSTPCCRSSPAMRRNGSGGPKCARTTHRARPACRLHHPADHLFVLISRSDAAPAVGRSVTGRGAAAGSSTGSGLGGGWAGGGGGWSAAEAAASRAAAARPAAAALRGAGSMISADEQDTPGARDPRGGGRHGRRDRARGAEQAGDYRAIPLLWALLAALRRPGR